MAVAVGTGEGVYVGFAMFTCAQGTAAACRGWGPSLIPMPRRHGQRGPRDHRDQERADHEARTRKRRNFYGVRLHCWKSFGCTFVYELTE